MADPRGPRWHWPLILLQSVVVALITSWPLVPQFGRAAIGSPDGDGLKHLWNLWWMRAELERGESGLLTRFINFPVGMDFYPIEPLHGLVGLLVPLAPVPLSNLLTLGHLIILGVTAAGLGRRVGGGVAAGLACGGIVQASAFTAFTLQCGVGELREVWWLSLGLWVWVEAQERQGWRWYLTMGAVLAASILSCFYHGFFLAVLYAALSVPTLTRRSLPRYALSASLALALTLPAIGGFAGTFQGAPESSVSVTDGGVEIDAPGSALQIHEAYVPRLRAPEASAPYSGGRYLGMGVMTLAALGLWAAPRRAAPWLAASVVGLVLALGNVLWWDGEVVRWDGAPIRLPMGFINGWLADTAEPLNFPVRAVAIPVMGLAVMAALAVGRWPWLLALVPLSMIEVERHDRVLWPRETLSLADLDGLAGGGGEGAVADLAFASTPDVRARWRSLAAQMLLDRPIQSVPIERMDWRAHDGNRWMAVLPITTVARGDAAAIRAMGDQRDSFFLLRERGFDRILLSHVNGAEDHVATARLTALMGPPVAESAAAKVWAVPEIEADPLEIGRWHVEQAQRLRGD